MHTCVYAGSSGCANHPLRKGVGKLAMGLHYGAFTEILNGLKIPLAPFSRKQNNVRYLKTWLAFRETYQKILGMVSVSGVNLQFLQACRTEELIHYKFPLDDYKCDA